MSTMLSDLMILCAVDDVLNEMHTCHVIAITAFVSLEWFTMFWEVEVKLLNDESMHLHNYETVELYAQSDGGAFAQSDGEAY